MHVLHPLEQLRIGVCRFRRLRHISRPPWINGQTNGTLGSSPAKLARGIAITPMHKLHEPYEKASSKHSKINMQFDGATWSNCDTAGPKKKIRRLACPNRAGRSRTSVGSRPK